MDIIELLGDAGRLLFQVLAVIFPLLLWQWLVLLFRPARGAAAALDVTVISGAMVGLASVITVIPPMALGWDAVVSPLGIWDLTLVEFYVRVANFAGNALPALLDGLLYEDPHRDLLVWVLLALVVWLLRMAIVLLSRRARHAGQMLAAELLTFTVSLFGVVYLAPLLLWSVNRMNFWLLLVLILLIQDHRYNEPPVISRLFASLNAAARVRRVGFTGVD
jgi:hypothetical protein